MCSCIVFEVFISFGEQFLKKFLIFSKKMFFKILCKKFENSNYFYFFVEKN